MDMVKKTARTILVRAQFVKEPQFSLSENWGFSISGAKKKYYL